MVLSDGDDHLVVESIRKLIQDSLVKAGDLRNAVDTMKANSTRVMSNALTRAHSEVNETFQFFVSLLEERRTEVLRELDLAHAARHAAVAAHAKRANETIDKFSHVRRVMVLKLENRRIIALCISFRQTNSSTFC